MVNGADGQNRIDTYSLQGNYATITPHRHIGTTTPRPYDPTKAFPHHDGSGLVKPRFNPAASLPFSLHPGISSIHGYPADKDLFDNVTQNSVFNVSRHHGWRYAEVSNPMPEGTI